MRVKRMGMREGRSALRKGLALVCAASLAACAEATELEYSGKVYGYAKTTIREDSGVYTEYELEDATLTQRFRLRSPLSKFPLSSGTCHVAVPVTVKSGSAKPENVAISLVGVSDPDELSAAQVYDDQAFMKMVCPADMSTWEENGRGDTWKFECDTESREWPKEVWPDKTPVSDRHWVLAQLNGKEGNWSGLTHLRIEVRDDVNGLFSPVVVPLWRAEMVDLPGDKIFGGSFMTVKPESEKMWVMFNDEPRGRVGIDYDIGMAEQVGLQIDVSEAGVLRIEYLCDGELVADGENIVSRHNDTISSSGIWWLEVEVSEATTLTVRGTEEDVTIYEMSFWPSNSRCVRVAADYAETCNLSDGCGHPYLRGYVRGSGVYKSGETATLTAVAGKTAAFVRWKSDEIPLDSVSATNACLSFTVPDSVCDAADKRAEVRIQAVWRNLHEEPLPSEQTFTVGEAVSISLSALVGYEAHGLPTGLAFDPVTGTISGTVTEKTDESGVTVTFTKSGEETFSMQFIVGPFEIRFEAEARSGEYDGTGHGISVSVSSPKEGCTIEYAESEAGPWSAEPIAYTNVCTDQSIWFRLTAKGYETVTEPRKVMVTPRDIANATIATIDDQAFTGTDVKPVPVVTDGDPSIITTGDYDVSYADNVDIGTATLTLTGRGNYTGTKVAHFAIRRFDPRTVVFDALGGQIASAGAVTQTLTRVYGDLPTATREGYCLDGWFLGVTNDAPEAVGGATLLMDADHALYARWSIDSAMSPDPEALCAWEMTAEGTARITGLGASAARLAKLILPDYVGGLPVTEIAEGAFASTPCGVTDVTLPLFCTKIGFRAFTGIETLANVTFPTVVRDWQNPDRPSALSIGDYAFAGTGLVSVRLPKSVTSIGDFAFASCRNLAEVTILGQPTIGTRPFRRAGIAAGTAPVVRLDPALAGDTDYRDKILQDCEDAVVRTDAVVDGLSLTGLGVSAESVTVSVSVQRAADWGEVDVSALRVDYRANLGDEPQELVPNRVERQSDGSLAVEVSVSGEASGFFRVKLVR